MICEACGEANKPGAEFCASCNAFLGWHALDEDAPTPPTPTASPTVPTPGPTASPVPPPTPAAPLPVAPTPQPSWAETTVTLPPTPAPPPSPVEVTTPIAGQPCPACGRDNPLQRRFCTKCGAALAAHPSGPGGTPPTAAPSSSVLARERAARRDYRRSLPALYRFRRVGIVVVVVGLITAAVVVTDRHPVAWTRDRYYEITKTYVSVPAEVRVEPAKATSKGTAPGNLIDGTDLGWSTPWTAKSQGTNCLGVEAAATVVVTFPATRVRRVQVFAGFDPADPVHVRQFTPTKIALAFDNGLCVVRDVHSETGDQIDLDSQTAVSELGVSVAAVAAPTATPVIKRTTIRELDVQAFPG